MFISSDTNCNCVAVQDMEQYSNKRHAHPTKTASQSLPLSQKHIRETHSQHGSSSACSGFFVSVAVASFALFIRGADSLLSASSTSMSMGSALYALWKLRPVVGAEVILP